MAPRTIAAMAAMLGVALASPLSYSTLVPRQGESCGPLFEGIDDIFFARIGYFTDSNCNNEVSRSCLSVGPDAMNDPPGTWGCTGTDLPEEAPVYLKVTESPFPNLQILFTRDQLCPPGGAGAVFATLVNNDACVQSNLAGSTPGITLYPNGGAPIAREQQLAGNSTVAHEIDATAITIKKDEQPIVFKRQETRCNGFRPDDFGTPSRSATVQVSNIIDCTNGGDGGCDISVGEQQSQSITTSYSVSAGASIAGIVNFETTFGQDFTETVTTSVQTGFNINAGQRGYIGAYSGAQLFEGVFTECDSGDAEQPGSVLALKANEVFYSIILTGAGREGVFEEEQVTDMFTV